MKPTSRRGFLAGAAATNVAGALGVRNSPAWARSRGKVVHRFHCAGYLVELVRPPLKKHVVMYLDGHRIGTDYFMWSGKNYTSMALCFMPDSKDPEPIAKEVARGQEMQIIDPLGELDHRRRSALTRALRCVLPS
jgi:hypothetical protein